LDAVTVAGERYRRSYRSIAEAEGKTYEQVRREHIAAGTASMLVMAVDGRVFPGSYSGRFERARKAQALRATGWTIRAIAAELACSTYTTQRDLEMDWTKDFRRRR
jgi:hypothetical protein